MTTRTRLLLLVALSLALAGIAAVLPATRSAGAPAAGYPSGALQGSGRARGPSHAVRDIGSYTLTISKKVGRFKIRVFGPYEQPYDEWSPDGFDEKKARRVGEAIAVDYTRSYLHKNTIITVRKQGAMEIWRR